MNTKHVQGSTALRGARTQALKETAATRRLLVTNLKKLNKQALAHVVSNEPDAVIRTSNGSVYVQTKKPAKNDTVWFDKKKGLFFVQVDRAPAKFVVRALGGVTKKAAKSK